MFKPISPTLSADIVVADLNKEDNHWDEDKLNQHFIEVDAAMILKISLPKEHLDDDVLWHYDKMREYSVKNEYQLALRIKFSDAPSRSESMSQYWSALWSLELPEKNKNIYVVDIKQSAPINREYVEKKSLLRANLSNM